MSATVSQVWREIDERRDELRIDFGPMTGRDVFAYMDGLLRAGGPVQKMIGMLVMISDEKVRRSMISASLARVCLDFLDHYAAHGAGTKERRILDAEKRAGLPEPGETP